MTTSGRERGVIVKKKLKGRIKGIGFFFFAERKMLTHSLKFGNTCNFFQKNFKKKIQLYFFFQEKFTFNSLNFSEEGQLIISPKNWFLKNTGFLRGNHLRSLIRRHNVLEVKILPMVQGAEFRGHFQNLNMKTEKHTRNSEWLVKVGVMEFCSLHR